MVSFSRGHRQRNNFLVIKKIIRRIEFLLGSPHCCPSLTKYISIPLGWQYRGGRPKLGTGYPWSISQTLVLQIALLMVLVLLEPGVAICT